MKKSISLLLAILVSFASLASYGAYAAAGVSSENNGGSLYFEQPEQTEYKYTSDTVIPAELTGATENNFTFETDLMIGEANSANFKLNLYSSNGEKIISLNFGQSYMTADNEKNNMYGKTAELPYDSGANGNEWSYIMLPGIGEKNVWKNIKLYFDFSKREYDLYMDNCLVADDNYFTNEDAADLASMEFVAANGTDYILKNTYLSEGFSGLYIKPFTVVDENGEKVSKLEVGKKVTARMQILLNNLDEKTFTVNYNGAESEAMIPSDGEWHNIEFSYVPESENDNLSFELYEGGEQILKSHGFISSPAVKDEARIFIIGDSTVGPHMGAVGWSAPFAKLVGENSELKSYGRSGTSTRTYWHSGRPDVMGYQMSEGDYLLFQLGHNDCADAKTGTGVKNTTIEEYKNYIKKYIAFARFHGVHPVFVTSPSQNRIGSVDQFSLADNATPLYPYVTAMKEMAAEYGIETVDLYQSSRDGFKAVREAEGSLGRLYADGTHFSADGARMIAGYVANGLRSLSNGAGSMLKKPAENKEALRKLVEANETKSSADYQRATYDILMAAIKNAKYCLDDESALSEEVDSAYAALEEAVNGLKLSGPEADITVKKDSYTDGNYSRKSFNYGVCPTIVAKQPNNSTASTHRRVYLGFDISDIPDGATRVVLKTYAVKVGSNGTYTGTEVYVHGSDNTTWAEGSSNGAAGSGITFNNQPSLTANPIAGLATNAGYISKEYARWFEFDVTDYVLSKKAKGKSEITLALTTNDSGSAWFEIEAKENPDGNVPKLTYSSGSVKTIKEQKEEDLANINICDYINDVSVDAITKSLKPLPTVGTNGYEIVWTSNNSAVLSPTGEVNVAEEDTPVTLTASIISDGLTISRDFDFIVRNYTQFQIDFQNLTFDTIKGQNTLETDIKYNLVLPEKTESGSGDITWTSDKPEVVSNDGKVVRNALEKVKTVSLTAEATDGFQTLRKVFTLRVPGDYYINDACSSFDNAYYATSDLTVLTEETWRISGIAHSANGKKGQYLVYEANEGAMFEIKTVVNKSPLGALRVTFATSEDGKTYTPFTAVEEKDVAKAIGAYGGYWDRYYMSTEALPAGTKYLKVIIPDSTKNWHNFLSGVKIFDADSEMKFENIIGENASIDFVTTDLNLVNTFEDSEIAWSSNSSLVSADGTVSVRPAEDTSVRLTAVITKDGVSTTKCYDVTVKAFADKLCVSDIPFAWYMSGGNIAGIKGDSGFTSSNTLYASAEFTNITNEDKKAYVGIAVYEAVTNKLLNFEFKEITVSNKTAKGQTFEVKLPLTAGANYGYSTVKAFAWDENFMPFSANLNVVRTKK